MSWQFHVRVRPAKMSSQPARSCTCQQTVQLRQLNAAAEAEATETLLLELLLRKMLL
jgi:hypothetical protein